MRQLVLTVLACICLGFLQAQPSYNLKQMQREQLGRGFLVFQDGDSLVCSWRLLPEDPADISFNILSKGQRINPSPITRSLFFKCPLSSLNAPVDSIVLEHVSGGFVSDISPARFISSLPYLSIPLHRPEGGTTPDGWRYIYNANDASVGDVDGDGEYEIILKWEPSNAHDNSHAGYTGPTLIDCYKPGKQNGFLWRINLGINIRSGAHYTPFLVYDFDGDGRAELAVKTADGTRDALGNCIGDSTADYRTERGTILTGPEFLTVFDGQTGRAITTTDYIPPRGYVNDWGDNYGNRSERYLACVAYLDGIHPSIVMCRGYYTRTVLAAFDLNGDTLQQKWVFDTNEPRWHDYAGQGNHNLRVADVDGDGCDEIIYGAMALDHDGTGLYNTRMGHGDAIHLMPFFPDSTSLQVWNVHENRRDGSELHDARTGRILFQLPSNEDVGRGMAADIDPTNPGVEMWSTESGGIRNVKGEVIARPRHISINSAVWWDGDLLRELLDHGRITKYNWKDQSMETLIDWNTDCTFNNGTKSNPCLSADILGDWREEVIIRTKDNRELRIYSTPLPTGHRLPTLMSDIPYRLSVATQNVGYNQPPDPGFYLGAP